MSQGIRLHKQDHEVPNHDQLQFRRIIVFTKQMMILKNVSLYFSEISEVTDKQTHNEPCTWSEERRHYLRI